MTVGFLYIIFESERKKETAQLAVDYLDKSRPFSSDAAIFALNTISMEAEYYSETIRPNRQDRAVLQQFENTTA